MYFIPSYVALALYGASAALYMLYFAGFSEYLRVTARIGLVFAAFAHLFAIGYHHVQHLAPPVLSPLSLVNLAVFVIVASYLLLHFFFRTSGLGGIIATFAAVVLGTLINSAGQRIPGIRAIAVLTPLHIAASAVGFLCFLASAVASALRLIAEERLRKYQGLGWPPLPPITSLDTFIFRALRVGFPFYTVGIILGAIWAYWGGEEPPMVGEYLMGVGVWVLYASLILASLRFGWRGRRAAVLVLAGFTATLSIVLMYAFRRFV